MIVRLKALLPWFLLLFMGVAWGLSFSLARIAVSAGGMAFGITFWQNALCAAILLAHTYARRRPLPVSGRHIRFYFIVACLAHRFRQAVSIWQLNSCRLACCRSP